VTALLKARVQNAALVLRLMPDDVFVPNLMSWFSAAQMRVRPGDDFLDVGTGTGLHAILAAKLARENARRNGVERVCRFLEGSLAEPLTARGLRVDAIVYNAPHFPARLVDPSLPASLIRSVSGGGAGSALHARFLKAAHRVLAPGGRVYLPVVAWSDPATSRAAQRAANWNARVLARAHIPDWGRGNNTRPWLLARPGRHVFAFRHAPSRLSAASVEELTLKPAGAPPRPLSSRVEIDFRPG
jgi:release factor glutamine methyltransferase